MDKEVLNESLLIASANGEVQQVQSLINQGSDVNYVGVLEHSLGFGLTPLMLAIKYNYPDVVKVLVENNADVNYKTPFLYVSEYGTPEILQILMENGADTTVTNNYGSNALQLANYQNTKFLLDLGFKEIINYRDKNGNTALHLAHTKKNRTEILIELLKDCANTNIKNNYGTAPLHLFIEFPEDSLLLLKYGADPNIKDYDGNTALDSLNAFLRE